MEDLFAILIKNWKKILLVVAGIIIILPFLPTIFGGIIAGILWLTGIIH